jgi:hypothetical protein
MKLFKSNLKKRLETLEGHLGVLYTVDADGYGEYKRDGDDKWNVISRLEERVKALETEKGKK